MCLGLASGFIKCANEIKPTDMDWKTSLEDYIEKKKIKPPAKLEDYNAKHRRMGKNKQRGV